MQRTEIETTETETQVQTIAPATVIAVAAVTAPEVEKTPDLGAILRGLDSANGSVQREAIGRAQALPPESLLYLMQMESASYWSRLKRGSVVTFGAIAGLLALCVPFANLFGGIMGALAGLCLVLAIWLIYYVPMRAHKALEAVITQIRDPRFVGPALNLLVPDSMNAGSHPLQKIDAKQSILSWLTLMLPDLKPQHRALLTKEQMKTLYVLLGEPYTNVNLPLVESVLRALQQVGDESAEPSVRRLIRHTHPKIRDEAQATLDYLRLSADQRRQSQTLLRASDAEQAAPETLLRPAIAAADPPEQLLRPQA